MAASGGNFPTGVPGNRDLPGHWVQLRVRFCRGQDLCRPQGSRRPSRDILDLRRHFISGALIQVRDTSHTAHSVLFIVLPLPKFNCNVEQNIILLIKLKVVLFNLISFLY